MLSVGGGGGKTVRLTCFALIVNSTTVDFGVKANIRIIKPVVRIAVPSIATNLMDVICLFFIVPMNEFYGTAFNTFRTLA